MRARACRNAQAGAGPGTRGREREKLLATRQAHRDQLDAERKAAQTALAAIETRLRDARGEGRVARRALKMIDPGIVPERPSSPNLPLNVAAALLLGLVLPTLYLTLAMNFQDRRAAVARGNFRASTRSARMNSAPSCVPAGGRRR